MIAILNQQIVCLQADKTERTNSKMQKQQKNWIL